MPSSGRSLEEEEGVIGNKLHIFNLNDRIHDRI
jgi:hypothetical protein